MFWENSIQAIKMQTSVVVYTGNKVTPPRSEHPIWEDSAVAYKNQTEPGLIYSFTFLKRIIYCMQFLSFDMWSSMSFLKVLQILWVMWYIQWTQKSYHVSSGCLEEIEDNGKL